MNKMYTLLSAAALAVFIVSPALAQRKNTTSHDVKPVNVSNSIAKSDKSECKCGKDENCRKKCKKEMKKDGARKHHNQRQQEQLNEINEDYAKALKKIDASSFSAEQKELLKKQAMENKELSLQQAEVRSKLMQQQADARRAADMRSAMNDKANRKAVKKVMNIGG